MSLFDQLRRLYRKDKFEMEDFHTEIVAQVLRNSHGLTMAWLNGIKATSLSEPDCVTVVTQEKFAKLARHATDSRPDIAIKVTKGAVVELILVESKVDAKQGPEQLQRYTEHLAAKTGFDHTTLVFVTREFELPHSLSKLPPNVEFRQTRWFEFYNFLKAHVNSDGLARELKLFMEKNRMSLRNQFTAIDSLALGNFRAAKSLMDETLWSEVNNEFKALGAVSSQKKAITSLANWGLYVMSAVLETRTCIAILDITCRMKIPPNFLGSACGLSATQNQRSAAKFCQAFGNSTSRPVMDGKQRVWTMTRRGLQSKKSGICKPSWPNLITSGRSKSIFCLF